MVTRLELAPDIIIWQGDVRESLRQMPDKSVQTCVTSPPYFGLRDYGTGDWEGGDPECDHQVKKQFGHSGNKGNHAGQSANASVSEKLNRTECSRCGARKIDNQIGLEPTVDDYVQTMVEVFREVRRVLRDDGTLWLNLGDSYNGSGGAGGDYGEGGLKEGQPKYPGRRIEGLKPKDLIGVPWRVAFALQADGWYLRSDIIWAKPNPMPESVTDRPTKAHEYLFLLSTSPQYYYDADAIREEYAESSAARYAYEFKPDVPSRQVTKNPALGAGKIAQNPAGRNKRTVWTISTKPFPEAHFATFPPELPELCVLAGSSPKACPKCVAPWERVVERQSASANAERDWQGVPLMQSNRDRRQEPKKKGAMGTPTVTEIGWKPTCSCEENDGSGRCVVLDPFNGSGTTGQVAIENGRAYIGCELNPEYIEITKRRLRKGQTTLLGQL